MPRSEALSVLRVVIDRFPRAEIQKRTNKPGSAWRVNTHPRKHPHRVCDTFSAEPRRTNVPFPRVIR